MQELLFARFKADGVDHRLALDAAQTGFDDAPLGRVHHDGNAADVGLRGHEVEKRDHGFFGIEHALVHVHINDLRTILHLGSRNVERGLVIARQNELLEAGGARDVAAFTDVHEQAVVVEAEGLQATEVAGTGVRGQGTGCDAFDRLRDGGDMRGGRATAATGEIDKPAFSKLAKFRRQDFRCLVVLAEGVGQARIEVSTEVAFHLLGHFLKERADVPERSATVAADDQGPGVGNGIPEGGGALA